MIYPTLITDNFFDNPDEVRDFALQLPYSENSKVYPGVRTPALHKIHPDFFKWSTNKIISTIFHNKASDSGITFTAYQSFQKIAPNPHEGRGWIHSDNEFEFTAIIYMSKHKGCGTCFYKRKFMQFPFDNPEFHNHTAIKHKYYGDKKKYTKEYFDARDAANEGFEKTLEVDSLYNRLLIFDGSQIHGVENFFQQDNKEPRLTLITFFNDIQGIQRFPIPTMRRHI